MNANTSSTSSGGVRTFVNELLKTLRIPFSFTDHIVRKVAHFTEFMTLGILLTVTIYILSKPNIFIPLFVGLFTAVFDEFIQLFVDGRSGQVSDVVLDFSGFIVGVFFVMLIYIIIKRRKEENDKDK